MFYQNGFKNENEIITSLNNKKVKELTQNMKFNLEKMFGKLDEEEIILCSPVPNYQKPDIQITYRGETKYISVKCGRATQVHEEYFATLIPFLKESGLTEDLCDFFLRFCYADGTNDGSGIDQMDFTTAKMTFDKEIKLFNKKVMDNKDFIKKVISRCLFEGSNSNGLKADYIYFGNSQYGVLCSKTQFFKHIDRRDWAYMENPHIGPLQFRPHIRGKVRDESHAKRKHQCDIWWANLNADMEYISERYSD